MTVRPILCRHLPVVQLALVVRVEPPLRHQEQKATRNFLLFLGEIVLLERGRISTFLIAAGAQQSEPGLWVGQSVSILDCCTANEMASISRKPTRNHAAPSNHLYLRSVPFIIWAILRTKAAWKDASTSAPLASRSSTPCPMSSRSAASVIPCTCDGIRSRLRVEVP